MVVMVMVKGWVMVVVKVIMVMMVEVNCSKNSLFFFWFLDGDSNCKFSVNQSPNPLILGLEILDLDFGLDNYKVLMLVGQDSVCVWCCVWCVQQCSAKTSTYSIYISCGTVSKLPHHTSHTSHILVMKHNHRRLCQKHKNYFLAQIV